MNGAGTCGSVVRLRCASPPTGWRSPRRRYEEDFFMGSNPLRVLNTLGQSVWFDYIRRLDLKSGHIKALIDNDGVSGITSNPSIFEKAISGGDDYDASIRKL